MGLKIEYIINQIEKNIGDPEEIIALKRDLETLKFMSSPTSFYIKGVGSSDRYNFYRDASSNDHRFLVSAIETMLEDLIEKHLPHSLKRRNNEDANKAWALLYFHEILKEHNLGDPQIWSNREYIRADDNNGLEESIVYLSSGDALTLNRNGLNSVENRQFSFYLRVRDWTKLSIELRKYTLSETKVLEDLKAQIGAPANLTKPEHQIMKKWFRAKENFLSAVMHYVIQLEKLEAQKEED